jgi:23S rRNA (uracil1939-C5)-methyltransferase
MDEVIVEIQKLVNGGQGLGFYEGKPVFVWNALPGETAVVEITREKRNYSEGIAVRINDASPERIKPEETHFPACGPWQIMTFAHENHWKKKIAKETFKRMAGIELPDFEIIHDQNIFGYRNKIEYGFCTDDGNISLAFHQRGATDLFPIDDCLLAKENINRIAARILESLNQAGKHAGDLKNLILRENHDGLVLASLIVNSADFHIPGDIACDDVLIGFHLYFSNPKHPMPFKLRQSLGSDLIIEKIAGKTFKCGPLSFFQVNLDVFKKTLSAIDAFVVNEDEIVDFYSGVGAIGISLGDKVRTGVLIESNRAAAGLAGENIKANGLENFKALCGSSEEMLDEIKKSKTIVFDPPRAGLHPDIVRKVLEIVPRKIIYLSCDIATQARDLKMLSGKYEVKFCELYNFFPRTPHIESLLVLEST